jgi:hypothetical protein
METPQISKVYSSLALMFFNISIVFIIFNLFLFLFYTVIDRDNSSERDNPVIAKYGEESLKAIYPEMTRDAIDELLRETWSRHYVYEDFTLFKEAPYSGLYVNVSEHGFRVTKNQGPWPPESDRFNIFLFGGSTAFGYGVSDDQTIASYLQDVLSDKQVWMDIAVYNFGRGSYFSHQERILYEKLLMSGYRPDLVIFLDGFNDFYLLDGKPAHSDRLKHVFLGDNNSNGIAGSESDQVFSINLPITRLTKSWSKYFKQKRMSRERDRDDEVSSNIQFEMPPEDHGKIIAVVEQYFNNMMMIDAVAKKYNVRTLFVWQPVPSYKYESSNHLFSAVDNRLYQYIAYGYNYMESILEKRKPKHNFLWAADLQQDIQKPLYVDVVHYSAEMCKLLAVHIGEYLLNANLLVEKSGATPEN